MTIVLNYIVRWFKKWSLCFCFLSKTRYLF